MSSYLYTITPILLRTIKEIVKVIADLNGQTFPKPILLSLENLALATSSHTSTSIEGNPLPLTDVKQILKNRPENLRESELEVVNYNDTLVWLNQVLVNGLPEINLKFILEVHKRTLKGLLSRSQLGKIRQEPVFVNDPILKKKIYWPPDQSDVEPLLLELIQFVRIQKGDLDAIILAGIFHKQFVIIHPFMDGNGRTIRLVTKALLASLGIDVFSLFSFENYYNNNVTQYFANVGVRGNYYELKPDMTTWLEYFAAGILDELQRVRKLLGEEVLHLSSPSSLLSKDHEKILRYIDKNGFIRDSDYAKLTKRAKATRTLDFNKLVQLGYIKRFGMGKLTHYKRI